MPRGRLYAGLLIALLALFVVRNAIVKPGSAGLIASEAARTAPVVERPPAPDFNMVLTPGAPPTALSSLKGKVVILDFWATWCGPCRMAIPELQKLYDKYHSQGLEVVGLSVDDTADPVPGTVKELGMTYPVTMAKDIPNLADKYAFYELPHMYIIDKLGRQAADFKGYNPNLNLEAAITTALAE